MSSERIRSKGRVEKLKDNMYLPVATLRLLGGASGITICAFATVVAATGAPTIALRSASQSGEAGILKGLLRRAVWSSAAGSMLGGALLAVVFLRSGLSGSALLAAVGCCVLSVVCDSYRVIVGEWIRGTGRQWTGMFLSDMGKATLTLPVIVLLIIFTHRPSAVECLVATTAVSVLMACPAGIAGARLLASPDGIVSAKSVGRPLSVLIGDLAGMASLQGDVVAGGFFLTAVQLGQYGLALRLVQAYAFVLSVGTTAAGPHIARAALLGPRAVAEIAQSVALLASGVFALLTILAILLFSLGETQSYLGAEYGSLPALFFILLLGQAINIVTGPAYNVLLMSGHEQELRRAMLATVSAGIPLLLVGAFVWRPWGLAIASATFTGGQNILLAVACRRKAQVRVVPSLFLLRRTARRVVWR
jgi:O-antigen/teichoic acid export membrane protein